MEELNELGICHDKEKQSAKYTVNGLPSHRLYDDVYTAIQEKTFRKSLLSASSVRYSPGGDLRAHLHGRKSIENEIFINTTGTASNLAYPT